MRKNQKLILSVQTTIRVPQNVFRFLLPLLFQGRAVICIKSCLTVISIGKQCEALRMYILYFYTVQLKSKELPFAPLIKET